MTFHYRISVAGDQDVIAHKLQELGYDIVYLTGMDVFRAENELTPRQIEDLRRNGYHLTAVEPHRVIY